MSIYIARSPYRTQLRARPTARRRTYFAPSREGASANLSVNLAGSARRIREATMKLEFGPSMAIVGLFLVAALFMLLYLAHFNQVATKGYDLRRLEADRQQLMNQHDIRNMKLAEVKSLASIIASDRVSVMRKPGEITYIRGNTAIASR